MLVKRILYLTILIIVIPFFIVIFTFPETDKKKEVEEEKKVNKIFVRLKKEDTGNIEKIELEDYIVGVVAGEMPITFHIEALKAQAVAARSYVLRKTEDNKDSEYDVVDSTTNQVFLNDDYLKERWKDNYEENIKKLEKAVSETSYQYISYNGEIADALFFSTSNGYTEDSEKVFSSQVPYLRSVISTWDEETSPVFNDKEEFKLEDFFDLLEITNRNIFDIKIIDRSSTGRINKIIINGVEMKGTEVRSKLNLRSTDFEITKDANIVRIKTNGYGHGVGMSQYGALGMANNGFTYDEILKYYYQGVTIQTLKN
jgi:stage II sporulation protein D